VTERGAWANIPPKANRETRSASANIFIGRAISSNAFFNKIKHSRRIATRYDKLAENFPTALKLVAIRIGLRDNESPP
jgi:transposase